MFPTHNNNKKKSVFILDVRWNIAASGHHSKPTVFPQYQSLILPLPWTGGILISNYVVVWLSVCRPTLSYMPSFLTMIVDNTYPSLPSTQR